MRVLESALPSRRVIGLRQSPGHVIGRQTDVAAEGVGEGGGLLCRRFAGGQHHSGKPHGSG